MSVELCGCGHENDHVGKPCGHEAPAGSNLQKCPCPQGMRSDIALIRLTTQLLVGINNLNATAMKELALTQAATGMQVELSRGQNGDVQINVSPINQNDSGIVPASSIPNLKGVKGNG